MKRYILLPTDNGYSESFGVLKSQYGKLHNMMETVASDLHNALRLTPLI